jgi:ubiquinone/menaquinone biosynthesis C-methylase UbiE
VGAAAEPIEERDVMSDDASRDTNRGPQSPHVCPAQNSGWLTLSVRKLFNDPARIFAGLVNPGDTVVDLGCGPGFFTLPMAEMVGVSGQVIAVDVQQGMLDRLRARAEEAGVAARMRLCLSGPAGPGPVGPADLAVAFWMLHEVPDRAGFLRQVHELLKPGGRLLLVEPRGHVGKVQFEASLADAANVGLRLEARPRVGFSRAALLRRS